MNDASRIYVPCKRIFFFFFLPAILESLLVHLLFVSALMFKCIHFVVLCLCKMKRGVASGGLAEEGWSEVGRSCNSMTASHCTIQSTDH